MSSSIEMKTFVLKWPSALFAGLLER